MVKGKKQIEKYTDAERGRHAFPDGKRKNEACCKKEASILSKK